MMHRVLAHLKVQVTKSRDQEGGRTSAIQSTEMIDMDRVQVKYK